MKLYVAGSIKQKTEIHDRVQQLRSLGYTVPYDWTEFEQAGNTVEERKRAANRDVKGVREADVLLVFFTDSQYAYRGTFTEVGVALGCEKPIIAFCPDPDAFCRTNCFFDSDHILHADTFEQVLAMLKELSQQD